MLEPKMPIRFLGIMTTLKPVPDAATVSRPKNRYYDPSKPHHRPDGFQNNHHEFQPKPGRGVALALERVAEQAAAAAA